MFPAVTCAIPGGKRPEQIEENLRSAELPPLTESQMAKVRDLYMNHIRPLVHQRW